MGAELYHWNVQSVSHKPQNMHVSSIRTTVPAAARTSIILCIFSSTAPRTLLLFSDFPDQENLLFVSFKLTSFTIFVVI